MTNTNQLDHRKATARLRFLDAEGRPLSSRSVTIHQKKHKFLFGSGAFDSLPHTTPDEANDNDFYKAKPGLTPEFYKDRMDKWLSLFNYGTLPFYLASFEPREGEPETESRMRAAKFLREHDVTLKGHPLCWHTSWPTWMMEYDNKTVLDKTLNRIHRDVTAFKGIINMWDVINEVVIMPIFNKYDNSTTRLCKELGRVGLVKEVFAAAKAANPEGTFLINDFNLSTSYEILIDGCLNAGVPITAIGIQSHQHQGYWGREKLEEVLERYSHFGLPLHFTENTLVSGTLIPEYITDLNDWQVEEWPTNPELEERQANEWEEMYRVLFAHPLVEAITGWDFADGAWLGAPSGIVRKDNSIKPAYTRLHDMVKKEWWTDTTVTTDEEGFATVEGFLGTYEANCDGRSCTFSLATGTEETCILK